MRRKPSRIAAHLDVAFELVLAQAVGATLLPDIGETTTSRPTPLDERQRAAVASTRNFVFVRGGPGTGKTSTVAARAHALLDAGTKPAGIAVLAHSVPAAERIRVRIATSHPREAARMWIGTPASFGLEVVACHAGRAGLGADFGLLDTTAALALLERRASLLPKEAAGSLQTALAEIAASRRIGKNTSARMRKPTLTPDVRAAIETRYKEAKQEEGRLDNADVLDLAVGVLRNHPAVARHYRRRFAHVLVDDMQDLSRNGLALLASLGAEGCAIFAAGNARQAIRRFHGAAVAIFTVSSVACGFATSLPMMIVFRVLQGIGGGGLAPVEQSIFTDSFTPAKRAIAFALYGFTVVLAPAIGPMLGGWLTDNYSWHWVFFINLPVGVLSLVLTYLFVYDWPLVKEDRRKLLAKGFRIDYVGFGLVAVGFGALQVVLDRFEREDGFSSPFISGFAAVAAVSLVSLIVWELWVDQPIVNLRLFKSRAFRDQQRRDVLLRLHPDRVDAADPAADAGAVRLRRHHGRHDARARGMISIFIMPIAGIVTGKLVQPRWLVAMALAGTGYSMYFASFFDLDTPFLSFSLARAVQVMWLPFLFIPLPAVQFIGVPADKNNNASALINLMRNLGGSVGVAVATTELAWRNQFHHERLAEHITPFKGFTPGPALQAIAGAVTRQAAILSYLDVYWILAIAALVVCPLALFLPKMPMGAPIGH